MLRFGEGRLPGLDDKQQQHSVSRECWSESSLGVVDNDVKKRQR